MGSEYIVGVDEAGRGPLAGPLVVAGVLAERAMELDVKDSKMLSDKRRRQLFDIIIRCHKYAICIIEASVVDRINILNATKKGMSLVISELRRYGEYGTYVDGNVRPFEDDTVHAVIGGDRLVKPISAASILAKVVRDDLMLKLALQCPQYGWHKNFGYGTLEHRNAIIQEGLTSHHRRSFVKRLCGAGAYTK